jgi:dipeptidyl aminopeptidase/acylaminoacyl peptidase
MLQIRLSRLLLIFCVFLAALFAAPRPIEITDIFGWKRIQTPNVSSDGHYFAYRVVPNEGDSELVVRNLTDGKETRYPIGEVSAPGGGRGGPGGPAREAGIEFSEDGKWIAFQVMPKRAEVRKAKRDKKTAYNQVALVELATGKKTDFEKVRAYAFNSEQGGWLALHRYGAETPGAPPAPTPPGQTPPDRPGTDLILHELSTGSELNIGNVTEFAFNKPGTYLAFTIEAADKIGNGLQVRDMTTGAVMPIDSAKASYKSPAWTEKGDGLAVLKGFDDKAFEDKLYRVVGAKDFHGLQFTKFEFDPKSDPTFPAGMSISGTRPPNWTKELTALSFGIHDLKKKKSPTPDENTSGARPGPPANRDEPDKPDMLVWHWQDKRIQPMQQVQEQLDRNYSYLSLYWVAEKKFIRLADDHLRQVSMAPNDHFAIGRDNSPYELQANMDGQRYEDVYVVDPKTGARKLALTKNRNLYAASPKGDHFLYYEDGHFFAYDMANGQSKDISQAAKTSFIDEDNDVNVRNPPTRPVGWSSDGSSALISDGWDIWKLPVNGTPVNLTANGRRDKIRYENHFSLDPDEKGIDLAKPIYFSVYGEWTKKGGIGIVNATKPGDVKMLAWDDASYGNLLKAKHAATLLYTRQTVTNYPDYWLDGKKITTANPQQQDFLWSSGAKLIDYTCDQGNKAQAALFLPANYEPGKKYPTVVYIYEKLSQQMNTYGQPTIDDRFNRSVYNSNGYAVLTPDIHYKLNDPGVSAVGCVVPALKAAIAGGVVDAAKVGLQGHSWGGYETAFLVTQTNMFKTAMAGAPLTDMVSMYSSIYWNTGTTNQAIFEGSQARFTTGYMDNPQAYIRNSPVYQATNVKTPLLILHNDKDGAVDFTQGIEYYKTLRRLHKPVVMLEYKGENHHLAKPENAKDLLVRMREYFDFYLMDKPAPKWLQEGVPLIEVKDEVGRRADELAKPK